VQQKIIDLFKEISSVKRCSYETDEMRRFLIDKIERNGYFYKTDAAGNIYAYKNGSVLALQAHYDMVCVGSERIKIVFENGWLRAEDSSLGADNGIGVAIMLCLMEEYDNLEFLFTNDEEVGLIGAFNLDTDVIDIKSDYLLNLDSEDENIYIGCAGGADVLITYPLKVEEKRGYTGIMSVTSLPGGHSGVDIDKNVPNAIKELALKVQNVCAFEGGERRNSIPSNAKAEIFYECEGGEIKSVFCDDYLEFLRKLPHGVLEWDFEFKTVSKSVNLATVENEKIVLSIRANSNEKLEELKEFVKMKSRGAEIRFTSQYPAWKPEISKLSEILKEIKKSEYRVIHAGLECAVLKNKFPEVAMASIGPVILYPHSVREKVEIKSVFETYENVKNLIEKLS